MDQKNKWLNSIPNEIGYYLVGFIDGEGSFNVSLRKKDYGAGWQISPVFNVSQRDETILSLMKRHLVCGSIRMRKDGVHYYEVTNLSSLRDKVIPFLNKFQLLSSSKKKNFRILKEIVEIMLAGSHNNPEGFNQILKLRETLNEGRGRKRKYNIGDVI